MSRLLTMHWILNPLLVDCSRKRLHQDRVHSHQVSIAGLHATLVPRQSCPRVERTFCRNYDGCSHASPSPPLIGSHLSHALLPLVQPANDRVLSDYGQNQRQPHSLQCRQCGVLRGLRHKQGARRRRVERHQLESCIPCSHQHQHAQTQTQTSTITNQLPCSHQPAQTVTQTRTNPNTNQVQGVCRVGLPRWKCVLDALTDLNKYRSIKMNRLEHTQE